MKILLTGAAGFIGFHLARRLLDRGDTVVGIDNLNHYYDVSLKYRRLAALGIDRSDLTYARRVTGGKYPNFSFVKADLTDTEILHRLFATEHFDHVCSLAAQAGVRYSIDHPEAYIQSNIVGFFNLLECCRRYPVEHFVFSSSSSVYGGNTKVPFSETDTVDRPVSLYAATKKSDELMAYTYSHLYGIPVTGLRYFTVYGPWGRPDMSPILFADAITEGRPINVFNQGHMERDFTFVDDIVEGTLRVIDRPLSPYNIYNIGCGHPVGLMDFIHLLERTLGSEARLHLMPMQPGDVPATYADTSAIARDYGFRPSTSLDCGIAKFVKWYRQCYSPQLS